ncbi:MAG: hypothetical protein M1837_004321 [Sclerophora amabilis]|nr:MAG: hypothetical protein M1837_004321 [Sclerophora amabilis]
MAHLHSALQSLAPTDFSSIPLDDLASYLQDTFSTSRLLIDSVPLPSEIPTPPVGRSRSNTASSAASSASETSSSARPGPPAPEHEVLQKEWGKPIKLAAKDNPLGISVYKLSGKDGRGAWFARRSVHEGLGFSKFKRGLEREFPESLKVQGGPGEGNVRGIGGERRVERKVVEGIGVAEVYHLSAQFPGPTTPRDFVTLLLTSSAALTARKCSSADGHQPSSSPVPVSPDSSATHDDELRHYVVISRPCNHPDCPPRDGFIRGNYESIEFIREVPLNQSGKDRKLDKKDAPYAGRSRAASDLGKEAAVRNAKRTQTSTLEEDNEDTENRSDNDPPSSPVTLEAGKDQTEGRKRGRTISFEESRGAKAKGERIDIPSTEEDHGNEDDPELNPVEWIMITRSDPGGSVPRWMVERGTPAGIVADAGKFLDWACAAEHPHPDDEDEPNQNVKHEQDSSEDLDSLRTNGHLVGLDSTADTANEKEVVSPPKEDGVISNIAGAVTAGISAYAPNAVLDRLPGHQEETVPNKRVSTEPLSSPSTSSLGSFATADSGNSDGNRGKVIRNDTMDSSSSQTTTASATNIKDIKDPHERELAKLRDAKARLDDNLAKARSADAKRASDLSAKEASTIAKAEERHARETAKQEERYRREVKKLDKKREKEARKAEARERKAAERVESARLTREKKELQSKADALAKEVEMLKKEREELKGLVGDLQKENTTLVIRLGNREKGKEGEVVAEKSESPEEGE